MKEIFKKKFIRIFIAIVVGIMICGSVGILSACQKTAHFHHYEWKYEMGGTEHWKECPDDGVELEGSRGDHVFVDGECECGAKETIEQKTYGKAHGQVKLCGLGGTYDDDYSDVAVDMGDEVDPVFDSETGEFSVENLETGKIYTLTVTKPDYQPYVVSVSVEEEDEDVAIGGNRGMVLQRNSFDTTVNWGKYNLSKVNDETGEISLTNRHFMVLTKDTFDEVAFTLNLNGFKRPGGGVKEGLSLVGDDGQTIEQGIAIAFGQDVLTVRMVGKNKLALWNTWLAGEWKGGNALTSSQEKELYSFKSGEKFIKDFDANSLALTVYRKANNIAVFLNGTSVGNSTVDEKYKDMPCSIGIIGHNAVDDISWKHWSFSVDSGNKSVSVIDNTAQNAHGSVTGIPQNVNFGDTVTLTVTPDTDYKLSALLINGVNVIKDLDGNTYSFVVTKDTTVEAQFAQIVYSSVNATVSGKSFGKTTALSQGTDVTLTSNGFDDITTQLAADGLKIDKISAGVWTVNIEGYLPVEITVDDVAAYTTAIILERDPFNTTVKWGEFNFENANDVKGKFGVSDGNFLILSNEMYDAVAVTMYLNGSQSVIGSAQQGIAIAFGGTDVLTVRMVGKEKLALWNTWIAPHDNWGKGANALTQSQENGELYLFDADGQYLKDFDKGELRLTVYRTGNEIIVYLNGTMVGRGAVDAKYADAKCSIGFVGHDMASSWKYWDFTVETENLPAIQKFTVKDNTADGAHGSVTGVPEGAQDFGASVTITVTPETDYKLSALLINGVDVLKDIKNNQYTFTVKGNTTVEARFEAIVYSSVKSVVNGKSFGKIAALTVGTQITLSQSGSEDIVKTITANGLEIDRLSAGVWTVKAEGYLNTDITVIDGEKYSDVIVLERNAFDTTVNWNNYNFEKANEALGEFGTDSDNFLVLSNETFDKVAFTIYLNGKPTDNIKGEQGIALAFGMQVITVRMVGKEKLAIWNTWVADSWGGGAIDGSTENADLYYFSGEVGVGYLTSFDKGELRLTLLRNGHRIFIYLNDDFIGSSSFAEKYDTQKCSVGFVGHSMDKTWKYWSFAVNTEIPDVTVIDETAENAGGTISITPANVKVGDTVKIAVAPDDTHILGSLTVSGGVTPVLQTDGTYTFIATQKQHTVTATFTEKPTQEVEASVSGEKFDGTQTEIADGTKLVFTPQSGAPVTLTVSSDKKIKGALLPGKYQVTADGYYGTTVTVTETYTIENGITLKKLIFETNSINHSDTYLHGAANANPQKVVADANGKIYEWSIDEYDDVAVTFTFKRITGGVQGLLMNFAGGNKSVIVRFENTGDNATKAQWCGMEYEGVSNINSDWDFGDGEENANPLNSTLYGKYTGAGLRLTLVRKGGYVYALIDGKLYSSQRVLDYTNAKLKFALFVQQATAGYEIPFEITTDVDTVLANAGYTLSVFNGSNGEWTENEGKLTANGDDCYAQFTAPVGTVKESATIHIGNTNVGDQGFVYQFADGKHLGVRYQYDNGTCKFQYFPDPSFLSSDNTLSTGGWQGWDDIYTMTDEEKSTMNDSGFDLTFIRNGNTLYTLLGDKLIGTKTVDAKYADMGGAMFVTITNATGVEFTYSHAVGDAVTIPTEV